MSDEPHTVQSTSTGATKREAMVLPAPLDEWTADDIARITKKEHRP